MQSAEHYQKMSNIVKYIRNDDNLIAFEVGIQKFSIRIPKDKESTYFIEINVLMKGYEWLNRVNELILEKKPELDKIIAYIEKKYTENNKKKTMPTQTLPEINDLNIDMTDLKEERYKKKLQENLGSCKSKLNLDANANNTPIIFSGKAPGYIIINEFFEIRKKFRTGRVTIELVNENPYHWKLKFNEFNKKELNEQLEKLEKTHKYKYIEIDIQFHDHLYPGYPPFIRVVRPRLEDSLMHRITNLKMVQLDYWTPIRGMNFIVDKLQKILNDHCKIDVDSDMNDLTKYPDGSYHQLEAILIKLASLCDVKDEHEDLDKEEYQSNKTNVKTTAKKANKTSAVWSSGVGYGHSGTSNWDPEEYVRIQKEKDQQIQSVINTIIDNIQTYENTEEMLTVYNVIKSSYLIPFIKSYLKGTNMLDMGKHADMYKLLFTFLQMISTENSIFLFDDNSSESLYSLLTDLYKEAKQITDMMNGSENSDNGDDDVNQDEQEICAMVCTLYEMIQPIYKEYYETKKKLMEKDVKKWEEKMETAKNNSNPIHQKYIETLKEHVFDTCKFSGKFYYDCNNIVNRSVMMRLAKEYASMMKGLPICYESSIFVRVNEQNNKMVKVLITGPDNTPYDSGCFIFHLYTGDNYPNSNPRMIFINHGGERFNPNLYNCGKVCLSLLGTWSGNGGENWNPKTSTLSQLFISIQAQILVENPFYNEPGYESRFNNPSGRETSRCYSNLRRLFTMRHTMLDLLKDPNSYPEFKDVIINHFKLKKDYIKGVCEKWKAEPNLKDENGKDIEKKTIDTANELIAELDKLK